MRFDISGKSVLVTGAAGWLGGELAARLAAAGAAVTGLLRRSGPVRGNDGAEVPVRVWKGDITAALPRWTGKLDLIVHCAALTRFDADPALAEAVNVGGTARIVELARQTGARLLHVSTAYVNGADDALAFEHDHPKPPFTNAYEASKAGAEAVVRDAGVPAVILRPSIILGDWATGRVRLFGTFYYLLKLLAEGRVRQMPADPDATLDLVPVDHVARGTMALIEQFDAACGACFHLVSGAPTPLKAFGETLSRFPGLAVPTFVSPSVFQPTPNRLFDRVVAPYTAYFARHPSFDDRAFRRLTGLACPPVATGWWERLVRFAVEAGFVTQASRTAPNGMASEAETPSSAGSR